MLSFKWDNWTAFTTIFLKMCKLLSELVDGTVYEHAPKVREKVEVEQILTHPHNGSFKQ